MVYIDSMCGVYKIINCLLGCFYDGLMGLFVQRFELNMMSIMILVSNNSIINHIAHFKK